ncbi:MAG: DUF1328 domain-containing protein [Rhodothermaceae bacterium]|nr:DUF1328 domain-containing protein [Bacteroidota bacterium]MXW83969.1 DUF1328 domain-containing protein [Rhodothermaceae bacterium]MDE2673287.1 DUF1328 domain-containing protein [Bacteroidota bacterium]MXX58376.1 DUF1328 domain-containing protein [Rhodothermaceae bacterium]MXZ05639.1 DUF1328 domain-containing protein [Rhodothermaceae bacterium]
MRLDLVLRWIVIAIVIVAVVALLDVILGLVVGLAWAAMPILIILFVVGVVVRIIGGRRSL